MINQSVPIIDYNVIVHCLLTSHMHNTHSIVYVEIFRRIFSPLSPMRNVREIFSMNFLHTILYLPIHPLLPGGYLTQLVKLKFGKIFVTIQSVSHWRNV